MKRAKKETRKAVSRKGNKKSATTPARTPDDKDQDVRKLVHLLQVNQVELEHQNQELRIAEQELEASRSKYVNLFDFSPIPYFTLDAEEVIREVNLCAGEMLGVPRNKLIGKNIIAYLPLEERNVFHGFIKAVFSSPEKQSCKVKVISKDNREFSVSLEGVKSSDMVESDQLCQIALIDLTEYRKLEEAFKKLSNEH
jgi:PAS domain S-box-containing protein